MPSHEHECENPRCGYQTSNLGKLIKHLRNRLPRPHDFIELDYPVGDHCMHCAKCEQNLGSLTDMESHLNEHHDNAFDKYVKCRTTMFLKENG